MGGRDRHTLDHLLARVEGLIDPVAQTFGSRFVDEAVHPQRPCRARAIEHEMSANACFGMTP